MRGLLLAAVLGAALPAGATKIVGGDYAGADLTPANGDVLSGTFVNVRLFSIAPGATVYVDVGTQLTVYAATVSISGTLDASGRGQPGGSGGPTSGAGFSGFGGGPGGIGSGAAGAALKGGGGGAYGGAGGAGAGTGGGAGGSVYDSTGVFTSPISANNVFEGSGGGGGGGYSGGAGGNGGAGGGAAYLEAASMTVTGAILMSGATAAAVTNGIQIDSPGGGGGGSGGGLVLRVTGPLTLSKAVLNASGGSGGSAINNSGNTIDPGGGGGGGRIKIFARAASFNSVAFSTSAGSGGGSGGGGGVMDSPGPSAGAPGTASFGVVASSPTGFAAQSVYVSSIDWTWAATASFGDAPAASQAYRVFPATAAAPLAAPQLTSLSAGATEQGLTPNTTYFRFVTAFTDWGDSFPSTAVSTHTLASAPSANGFPAYGATSLTAAWTAGSPANPSYTSYEVQSALDAGFAAGLQDSFSLGSSSSPAGLSPNTTYYFRARAVNLDGVPTAFTASTAAATLALAPSAPAAGPVFITSAAFSWSGGANPSGTQYVAEVSSDNFFSLVASSATLAASATFFTLSPGTQYFFRARALNRASVATANSAVVSATAGNLSDVSPPSAPGTPVSDRPFSYDGTILFLWSPAQSGVGILDYDLLIGSFAGGNDVFNGTVAVASYTATGLATGRTYYAEVRARSNAGVVGPFSGVGVGVPVFRAASAPPIAKPFAWPNPFNPAQGAVQIGFFMPAAGDAAFKVYTLDGRLLREFSRSFGAGNQVASWDGADASGRRAAPGGYIVVVRAPGADVQRVKVAVLY